MRMLIQMPMCLTSGKLTQKMNWIAIVFNAFDYGLIGGLEFDLEPVFLGFSYNLGLNQIAKDDDLAYDIVGDAKIELFRCLSE